MKVQIISFLLVPLLAPLGLLQPAVPEAPVAAQQAWQRQVTWQPEAQTRDSESVFSAFGKGVQVGATRLKVQLGASKFAVGLSLNL